MKIPRIIFWSTLYLLGILSAVVLNYVDIAKASLLINRTILFTTLMSILKEILTFIKDELNRFRDQSIEKDRIKKKEYRKKMLMHIRKHILPCLKEFNLRLNIFGDPSNSGVVPSIPAFHARLRGIPNGFFNFKNTMEHLKEYDFFSVYEELSPGCEVLDNEISEWSNTVTESICEMITQCCPSMERKKFHTIDYSIDVFYPVRFFNELIHPKIKAVFDGLNIKNVDFNTIITSEHDDNAMKINGIVVASGDDNVLNKLSSVARNIDEKYFDLFPEAFNQLIEIKKKRDNVEKKVSQINDELELLIARLESEELIDGNCSICSEFKKGRDTSNPQFISS